jgi:hypothetical protein
VRRDLKIRGYTVGQPPNAPILIALAALLVSWIAEGGTTLHDVSRALFYMAITVWAYEEAVNGVNRFRKAIGWIALVLIAISIARAIG